MGMKLLGIILLAVLIGIMFLGPNKPAVINPFSKPDIAGVKNYAGQVLGKSIGAVNKQAIQVSIERAVDSTATRVINQVSTDASSIVSAVTDAILVNQLTGIYKSFSQPVQKQFKNNICK